VSVKTLTIELILVINNNNLQDLFAFVLTRLITEVLSGFHQVYQGGVIHSTHTSVYSSIADGVGCSSRKSFNRWQIPTLSTTRQFSFTSELLFTTFLTTSAPDSSASSPGCLYDLGESFPMS